MATNNNKSIAIKLSMSSKGLTRGIKKAKADLKAFSAQVKDISKGIAMSFGAVGAIIGKSVIDEFKNFEFAIAKVGAISGASAEDLNKLTESAKYLGKTTMKTAVEVANLQLRLSKMGYDTRQINEMTQGILDLSIAMDEDLGESATQVAAVLKTFQLDASQSGEVVDVMTKAFSSSALDLEKYTTAMQYVGAVAHTSGVGLNELTAMMEVLSDRQIKASTQGTGLRTMFIKSAQAGLTYTQALDIVASSTDKLARATELFGKPASAVAVILAETREETLAFEKALGKAEGTAKSLAAIMMNTLEGSIVEMESAISGLKIEVGELLATALRPLVEQITQLALTIDTRLVAGIIVLIGKIAIGAGLIWAVTSLGGVLLSLGGIIISFVGQIWLIIKSIWGLVTAVSAAKLVMVGEILLIIAVIASLAYLIVKHFGGVKETILAVANYFIDFGNVLTYTFFGIKKTFQEVFNSMMGTFNKLVERFDTYSQALDAIFDFDPARAKKIMDGLDGRLEEISEAQKERGKEISESFYKSIEDNNIGELTEEGLDEVVKGAKEKGKEFAKNFTDGIKSIPGQIGDFIKGQVGSIGGGAGGGKTPASNRPVLDEIPLGDEYSDELKDPEPPKWETAFASMRKFMVQFQEHIQMSMEMFSNLGDIVGNLFDRQIQNIESKRDAELASIDSLAISEEERLKKKDKAEGKYAAKLAKAKKKQWIAEKAFALTQAAIQTALSIIEASPNPLLMALAAGVGATSIASIASQAPPQFAEGGLVTGRTLAEIGEGVGTSASNPEVVAPLDKLKSMMGGMGGNMHISGNFKVKGTDLVLVLEETEQRTSRY